MKHDIEIQKNVMEELKCTPLINVNEIGVIVQNGIVTLTGTADSYPRKVAIEKAVKKVIGVRGIAEDIQVNLTDDHKRTDSELAQIIMNLLEAQNVVPDDHISILVEDSWVTVEGELDWDFQRKLAGNLIENVIGIKGITNNIKLSHKPVSDDIRDTIMAAFLRNATIDASKIDISIEGNKVVLSGKVNTWLEYEEAERSAWSTQGVNIIVNQLEFEDDF